MKDDRLYLIHILECIQRIESYTQEGREAFSKSRMKQDAVIRNFEIMGEAVKQISSVLKDTKPQVPWKRIAGFRDILIHDYMGVDSDEVWQIVERDLPDLKKQIESLSQGPQ